MDIKNKNNNKLSENKINRIKFIQCNVGRSYSWHYEFTEHFVKGGYDVGIISEPHIGKGNEMKGIPGYCVFQNSANSDKVKACIIVKQGLGSPMMLTQHSTPNISVVQLGIRGRRLIITSVYIEPDQDHGNTLAKLECLTKDLKRDWLIVGGDLNGWHTSWGSRKNNKRGDEIINLVTSNDLHVCNIGDTPTYKTIANGKIRSSIIDLTIASPNVFSKINDWNVNLSACPSSDHEAITFDFAFNPKKFNKNNKKSTFKYNTNKADWDKFNNKLLENLKRDNILQRNLENATIIDIDHFTKEFTEIVQKTCDSLFTKKKRMESFVPWWNEELQSLKLKVIHMHHRIQDLVKSKKSIANALKEREELKDKYANAISKASKENFREFCSRQGKEDVWAVTNRLLKSTVKFKPPSTLSLNGVHTKSSKDTANLLLSTFFPDDTPDKLSQHSLTRSMINITPDTPDDLQFTIDEINNAFKSMSPKKAPGPDHLTSDICHAAFNVCPDLITKLYNRCLEISYFPDIWKIAHVIAIPKPNKIKYDDVASYRPIGLLNIFGKILEKLIVNRINYHIYKNNLDNPRQFGFKAQKSTVDALHLAIDKIKSALKNKNLVLAVSLDIKAAFDNAWWPALLKRLLHIKCPKNIYKLIKNYLYNRLVTINFADSSASKAMTRGCIQGSVCGPVFWNIILDELLECDLPEGCHIQAFADDVLLIVEAKNLDSLQIATNSAIKIITDWGENVKLNFGPDKTQLISFSKKARKAVIKFNNILIKHQTEVKVLGVIIDNKLNFIKHVNQVINKAQNIYKKLCIFTAPTWGIHSENISVIYRQVVQPIITYAAGIWGTAVKYKTVVNKLNSFQRGFAIREIKGFRTISTVAAIALANQTPLHLKILEVQTIESTRINRTSCFLPTDLKLQKPTSPKFLPHPAHKLSINIFSATNQNEIDEITLNSTVKIYTDGSKDQEGRVGAAVVIYQEQNSKTVFKLKLHSSCSVFQAELFALERAVEWVSINTHLAQVSILSDCMSALHEISNPNSTNSFVVKIHRYIKLSHSQITFLWIKAHSGMLGNEEADLAAKSAAQLHKQPDFCEFPISYVKRKIKEQNLIEHNNIYISSAQGEITRKWFPDLAVISKFYSYCTPSFYNTQIFTGHSFSKQYLHRFKITSDNKCPCNTDKVQNIDHLLKECPNYSLHRTKHELTCNYFNVDPYKTSELAQHPETVNSFNLYSKQIISTLKELNKT